MKPLLTCLATAILMNLSAPPLSQGYLALAGLAPVLSLAHLGSRQRFLWGALAGGLMQLLGYYWIFYTVRDFGGVSPGLSVLGAVLFCLYQGLDLALWLWLFPILAARSRLSPVLVAPVLWYLLQAHLFPYVFPWVYGASFVEPFGLRLASGVLFDQGLGFVAVWLQAAWVLPSASPRWKQGVWPVLVLLGCSAWGYWAGPRHAPASQNWKIAVIQPSLIPLAKRDELTGRELFDIHYQRSARFTLEKVDMIVWPETAVPFALNNAPAYEAKLRQLAVDSGAAVVTGAIEHRDDRSYNSIFLYPPDGSPTQIYRKERLVAFSEQLPWFLSWAHFFVEDIGGLSPGTNNKPFEFRGKKLIPLVCYEALFSDYVRRYEGHLILNLTNDAWFGVTKASSLHLQQIRMRCMELGIPMVRATNSGISCWIDAWGDPHEPTGVYEATTVVYDVPIPDEVGRSRQPLWVNWVSLVVLGLGIGRFGYFRNRETQSQTA